MTLPFSDKPEKSSIYQDVKTTTLQDLTPDQFDQFKERMFSEGVNGLEDEYRRLLLLGLASDKISASGPIPGTFQVIEVDVNQPTTFVAFECPANEVYQIVAAGCEQFATNQTFLILKIRDNFNGKNVRLDNIGTGNRDFDLNEPIYITGHGDSTCDILLQAGGTGFSGSNLCQIGIVRVR